MAYHILADLVVVLHFTFIIFGLLGGLLALWRKWIAYIHIPAAIWASLIVIQGWICPLTPLENYLRMEAGAGGYSGGFIAHYIAPIIYPDGLTRDLQVNLGFIALGINIAIYSYVVYRRQRKTK
ncbi:MAG: DUF2784 domain-containing protein [Gammaproteobacteria bacterium]|nr:DUF2784 domain-containing protein [Gammaproteobacteria bacterium]